MDDTVFGENLVGRPASPAMTETSNSTTEQQDDLVPETLFWMPADELDEEEEEEDPLLLVELEHAFRSLQQDDDDDDDEEEELDGIHDEPNPHTFTHRAAVRSNFPATVDTRSASVTVPVSDWIRPSTSTTPTEQELCRSMLLLYFDNTPLYLGHLIVATCCLLGFVVVSWSTIPRHGVAGISAGVALVLTTVPTLLAAREVLFRTRLSALLVLLWAMRWSFGSAAFVWSSSSSKNSDSDEEKLHHHTTMWFWVWLAVWLVIQLLPHSLGTTSTHQGNHVMTVLGVGMYSVGFWIESMVEARCLVQSSNSASSLSLLLSHALSLVPQQHPSAIGQVVLWLGVALLQAPALVDGSSPGSSSCNKLWRYRRVAMALMSPLLAIWVVQQAGSDLAMVVHPVAVAPLWHYPRHLGFSESLDTGVWLESIEQKAVATTMPVGAVDDSKAHEEIIDAAPPGKIVKDENSVSLAVNRSPSPTETSGMVHRAYSSSAVTLTEAQVRVTTPSDHGDHPVSMGATTSPSVTSTRDPPVHEPVTFPVSQPIDKPTERPSTLRKAAEEPVSLEGDFSSAAIKIVPVVVIDTEIPSAWGLQPPPTDHQVNLTHIAAMLHRLKNQELKAAAADQRNPLYLNDLWLVDDEILASP